MGGGEGKGLRRRLSLSLLLEEKVKGGQQEYQEDDDDGSNEDWMVAVVTSRLEKEMLRWRSHGWMVWRSWKVVPSC